MKCEEIGELLPDYLQGRLNSDLTIPVEKHLAGCTECSEEAALWKNLALLPEEQPSPALADRFKAMLESYQEGRWEKSSLVTERKTEANPEANPEKNATPMFWGLGTLRHMPAAGIVWACLFLACGYLIGRHSDRGAEAQLNAVRQELTATRQMVALSMLQQQSASQRLEGVSWTTRVTGPNPEVLNALFHTLRFDSNVDVRLASLDALGRYAGSPEIRRELVDALPNQQSPLVQIAIVDLLVDMHDRSAVPQFRKFEQGSKLDPTVKKRVEWGIEQLN